MSSRPELLRLDDVYKEFPLAAGIQGRAGRVRVLNGVSLAIREGETFGLVGESGCGKTTLARLLVRLYEPTAGRILFRGETLARRLERVGRAAFYGEVQIVFQDPYSAFNPRQRVRDVVGEMLRVRGVGRSEEQRRVMEVLAEVGLEGGFLLRYPHELSGGQRQRLAIARALVVRPSLLIADEPVSALDLSIQARILRLLRRLGEKYGLTILFVSHDLRTVATFCDRVAVMYLGKIVEVLPASRLFDGARHPYTRALLASLPAEDPASRRAAERVIAGEVPSPVNLPTGCFFHPRCPLRDERCVVEPPALTSREDEQAVACFYA